MQYLYTLNILSQITNVDTHNKGRTAEELTVSSKGVTSRTEDTLWQ